MKGEKTFLYEGGIRVPFITVWPGVVKQGKTDFMCSFWDMLPTFAQMTGNKARSSVDGISLMPLLTGKGKQKEHEYFYFEFQEAGGRQAVRKGDWKLIRLKASQGDRSELKAIMEEAHVYDPNWPLLEHERKMAK